MDTLGENKLFDQDEVLKEIFKTSAVVPPSGLKDKIIQGIGSNEEMFLYEPVIGKKVWVAIAVIFLGLMVLALMQGESSGFLWLNLELLDSFNWSAVYSLLFSQVSFNLIEISFTYMIAAGACMLFGICYMAYYGVFVDWMRGRSL